MLCLIRKVLIFFFAGRDLIGVQNLIKKQQALIAEIANHEPQIEAVSEAAEAMVQQGHFLAVDIREKLAQLRDGWRNLKTKADKRRQDLDDSLQVIEDNCLLTTVYVTMLLFILFTIFYLNLNNGRIHISMLEERKILKEIFICFQRN